MSTFPVWDCWVVPDVPEGRSCPGWVCARINPGLNEDKPSSTRTLLGASRKSQTILGLGLPAESARSSPLPPFLPLIEISTQYYFNPHPLAPPPPSALRCRLSLPSCRLQRLSMRTSCLPELFPLGAGPGQAEVGTVWVVAAWWLSPASRTLFLLALSSLNSVGTPGIWGWLWGHPTLEHRRCAHGRGTGAPSGFGMCHLPAPCHLQPSQHGLAWVTGCSNLA